MAKTVDAAPLEGVDELIVHRVGANPTFLTNFKTCGSPGPPVSGASRDGLTDTNRKEQRRFRCVAQLVERRSPKP